MARSISDIKSEITSEFMRNESAAARYGFEPGALFSDWFGAASIENILFYVWAVCAWTVEGLVSLHKSEMTDELERLIAHRPKWYRDKVLAFMAGKELQPDSDCYDTSGMSDSEIAAARVVKHAVATESRDASLLIIKVAGESGGMRCPLPTEQERQLRAYISEIKDAGVRVSLVNMEADRFDCAVDIYYNALLLPGDVQSACADTISNYIENIPFNGEYTNMALIDALQGVEGVKIAELKSSSAWVSDENTPTLIDARFIPASGYFKPGNININMIAYDGE